MSSRPEPARQSWPSAKPGRSWNPSAGGPQGVRRTSHSAWQTRRRMARRGDLVPGLLECEQGRRRRTRTLYVARRPCSVGRPCHHGGGSEWTPAPRAEDPARVALRDSGSGCRRSPTRILPCAGHDRPSYHGAMVRMTEQAAAMRRSNAFTALGCRARTGAPSVSIHGRETRPRSTTLRRTPRRCRMTAEARKTLPS